MAVILIDEESPLANTSQSSVQGVLETATRMIESDEATVVVQSRTDLCSDLGTPQLQLTGTASSPGRLLGWFPSDEDDELLYVITLRRMSTEYSAPERRFWKSFRLGIEPFLGAESTTKAQRVGLRLALRSSFERVWITRFLRGGGSHASKYQTTGTILELLEDLAWTRYEGAAATSGFTYTSKLEIFLKKAASLKVRRFSEPIPLDSGFFRSPSTYRYVDGACVTYLIDNGGVVRGTVEVESSGWRDLCTRESIGTIPDHCGRTWRAHVDPRSEVVIQFRNGTELRRVNGHWRFIDWNRLTSVLSTTGLGTVEGNAIEVAVRRLRLSGVGAVLLVAEDADHLPDVVGSISSDAAKGVVQHLKGATASQLASSNQLEGLLSSDGLTTVDNKGRLVSAGDIIATSTTVTTGGGRTQAATAASRLGLAVKVSEDGPIVVLQDGQTLFAAP